MMRSTHLPTALFGALLLVTVVACGEPPAGDDRPAATPTPTPTPVALAPDCAEFAAEPQVDGPLADDDDVAAAQQARAQVALPSDEATVREIIATTSDWSFAFPHTDEEFNELMARNTAAEHAADLRGWATAEAPESFAGLWIDQAAGGVLTVAFATDVERYRDEVHERFGPEVRVVEADHTYAELEAVAAQVREAMMARAGAGEPEAGALTSTAVSEQHNRVSIGVLGGDEATRAELSERFGAEMICLDISPIPSDDQAQPAPWEPAPDADLSPDSTAIAVLVNEVGCAGGEPATGRIAEPEITYRDDAVVITMRVIPKGGPQTCPSNPDTPFTVELAEPLGDRELLDGREDPPVTPDLGEQR